ARGGCWRRRFFVTRLVKLVPSTELQLSPVFCLPEVFFRSRSMSDPTTPPSGPTKEQLKQAFKAFKKRLKLTQLDEDSRLSRSPLSSEKAKILAIAPPNQFPQEVWDELVKQGKLKKAGHGTYEMLGE